MSLPDVSVCVAVYKRHDAPNISTLEASLPQALDGLSGELVVALNGLSAEAAGAPEGAQFVAFPENRGVPVAWNAAAAVARAPVLAVVNDDVVLGPGSLRMMAEALRQAPDAGIVGPAGTVWDLDAVRHVAYVDLQGLAPGELVECDVVSGFCFATPRSLHSEVGGFDEALTPCSYEEVDYALTLRARGRRAYAVAGLDVRHRFGISAAPGWRRVAHNGRRESLRRINGRNHAHVVAKHVR